MECVHHGETSMGDMERFVLVNIAIPYFEADVGQKLKSRLTKIHMDKNLENFILWKWFYQKSNIGKVLKAQIPENICSLFLYYFVHPFSDVSEF